MKYVQNYKQTPEQRLVFLLLTLNIFHINFSWVIFVFCLGFQSHTTKEVSVPIYILSKVRNTQLKKSDLTFSGKNCLFFFLANTLFVAKIFTFIEWNLVHLKKKSCKKKSIGKMLYLLRLGIVRQTVLHGLANTMATLIYYYPNIILFINFWNCNADLSRQIMPL